MRINTTCARSVSSSALGPYQCPDAFNWSQSRSQSDLQKNFCGPVSADTICSSFATQADIRIHHENRRKSRRRCIDFGLGRIPAMSQISPPPQAPPLFLDGSNLLSPLLATYAGNDSDTSSLFDDIDIDMIFPQPPPMFTSLRRVHSSPLITAKETAIAKNATKKHRDHNCHDYASSKHQSALSTATSSQRGYWASTDEPNELEELVLELEGEALLSSNASAMNAIHSQLLAAHTLESYKHERRMPYVPVAVSASKSPKSIGLFSPSRLNERRNAVLSDSKYTLSATKLEASAMTASGKKLLHSRSTSSLLPHITQKSSATSRTHKTFSKAKSVLAPGYLELNSKNPEPLCPRRLDCLGVHYQVNTKHVSHRPCLASVACSGKQKTTKQAHLSNPFTSLSFANASLVPPRSLGSPFHHRPARKQPIGYATTTDPSPYVPKSFMDITPEQDMRDFTSRSRRELMRTWLARAGRGVLNWSQTLTQRPKHSGMYEA